MAYIVMAIQGPRPTHGLHSYGHPGSPPNACKCSKSGADAFLRPSLYNKGAKNDILLSETCPASEAAISASATACLAQVDRPAGTPFVPIDESIPIGARGDLYLRLMPEKRIS